MCPDPLKIREDGGRFSRPSKGFKVSIVILSPGLFATSNNF